WRTRTTPGGGEDLASRRPMRPRQLVLVHVALIGCRLGCSGGGGRRPADGGPRIVVRGQVARAPGTPPPIENVTITVIDPPGNPATLPHTRTDSHGVFQLDDVAATAAGHVR